jgi:hypothetical protein
LRFLALHLAIGASGAVLVVIGLIVTDAHALGRLIMEDRDPVVAIAMLMIGFVITLGSAAMGAAIMGLPYDDNGKDKGRKVAVRIGEEPILAKAGASAVRR